MEIELVEAKKKIADISEQIKTCMVMFWYPWYPLYPNTSIPKSPYAELESKRTGPQQQGASLGKDLQSSNTKKVSRTRVRYIYYSPLKSVWFTTADNRRFPYRFECRVELYQVALIDCSKYHLPCHNFSDIFVWHRFYRHGCFRYRSYAGRNHE